MNKKTLAAALCVGILAACGGSGGGAGGRTATGPLAIEPVFASLDFNRPLDLKMAGDGLFYVAEQGGRVWRFDPLAEAVSAELFLDLRDRVDDSGQEQGLLGIAPHPDYASDGRLFVYYTGAGGDSRLSAFRDGQETVLLDIAQPAANHNGGSLHFGPADGYLYLALGDGGGANDTFANAQNPATLPGSILRIDVDNVPPGQAYGIPPDNPYAPTDGPERDEVWAYGLRNPFRMNFERRADGGQRLWAGDVGQDRWEEINIIESGGNYGWNVKEGAECLGAVACDSAGAYRDPEYAYPHAQGQGQSVIGGLVYRGQRRPELVGSYLFSDFYTGQLWALDPASGEAVELLDMRIGPSVFAEDLAGELYLLDWFDGGIWRFSE